MPLDASLGAALAIVLVAGVVTGLAGFGFSLVSVPLLLLLYDPPTVVTMGAIVPLISLWAVVSGARREIRACVVIGLLPWAVAGLVIGVTMLERLDAAAIKLLAGTVVSGFALLLLKGGRLPGAGTGWATALAGFTSGALNTSAGLSGPPVVLLFTARGYGTQPFRATLAAYFLVINGIGLAALGWRGIVTAEHLATAAVLTPGALLGTLLGRRLVPFVSPVLFRRITLGLLLLTGFIGMSGAVLALAR